MTGITINQEIHFGTVMKRGGRWGWFETTAATRVARFQAYGNVHTKQQATELRQHYIDAAIAKAKEES